MPGVYIHIPFCIKKCSYCDFVSVVADTQTQMDYFHALACEIRAFGAKYPKTQVETVFFGGGTPSCAPPGCLEEILLVLRRNFEVQHDAEITLEANPGTVSEEQLSNYCKAGFNRISFGLQSNDDRILKRIGRIHSRRDFCTSFKIARRAGFQNINVDLMYALPGQQHSDVLSSVDEVCALRPEHISAYALHLEQGTPLYAEWENDARDFPDEDLDREMDHALCARLVRNGYQQYEISNFALPGYACRHNLKYWNLKEYIGFGAAAHSCYRKTRYANTSDVRAYILKKGKARAEDVQVITPQEYEQEFLMLKLRLTEGFSLREYAETFQEDFQKRYAVQLETLLKNDLLAVRDDRVFLTRKGLDLQNTVLVMLGI